LSVPVSDRDVTVCHNTTVFSQSLVMLAQHARVIALLKGAISMQLCMQWMVAWGAKQKLKKQKSLILICAKQFLHPLPNAAHGTSHACHTLDTPLKSVQLDQSPSLWKNVGLCKCCILLFWFEEPSTTSYLQYNLKLWTGAYQARTTKSSIVLGAVCKNIISDRFSTKTAISVQR